jgi:hypothetical protein
MSLGPGAELYTNPYTNALSFAELAKHLHVSTSSKDVASDLVDEDIKLNAEEQDDDNENHNIPIPGYQTFWCLTMADFMRDHQIKYNEKLNELRVPNRFEHAFDLAYGREKRFKSGAAGSASRDACPGDERVRKIREIYTHGFKVRIRPGEDAGAFHYITPSDDQLLFLESCLFASLPKIYGASDWATHHVRILEEWGRDQIEYFLMMITARRVGKTFSMSMFDAALTLVVPSLVIAVYSTGRRASKMLKEQVEKLILMTGEDSAKRIVQSNQEELFIAHKALTDQSSKRSLEAQNLRMDPTTSKLFSYPSSVKGNDFYTHIHIYIV